ncbi:hypothetical protein [Nocardia farcinica]|uniref:hypothetical protein n=1 Tax=Nocardia farcinica TaxID=37329 RepID=UPI000BF877B1|nr:hypothetical protein [Nocardia farcinica]
MRQVGVVFVGGFVEQRLCFGDRANALAVVALGTERSSFDRSDIGSSKQRQLVRPDRRDAELIQGVVEVTEVDRLAGHAGQQSCPQPPGAVVADEVVAFVPVVQGTGVVAAVVPGPANNAVQGCDRGLEFPLYRRGHRRLEKFAGTHELHGHALERAVSGVVALAELLGPGVDTLGVLDTYAPRHVALGRTNRWLRCGKGCDDGDGCQCPQEFLPIHIDLLDPDAGGPGVRQSELTWCDAEQLTQCLTVAKVGPRHRPVDQP